MTDDFKDSLSEDETADTNPEPQTTAPIADKKPEPAIMFEKPRHRRSKFAKFIAYIIKVLFITAVFFGLLTSASYFSVWYFITGEEIEVPNLIGYEINQVMTTLKPLGASVKLDNYEYSELIPEGHVISQYPYPGTKSKKGSPMKIVLSKGSPLISVPALIGENYLSAEVKIRAAGLKVGNHAYIYSADASRDKIISQDPLPLTGVPKEYKINLLIEGGARAKKTLMPDLKSFTFAEAKDILNRIGIELINIERKKSTEKAAGMILEQSPEPGIPITPQTEIKLVISAGG